MAAVELQEVHRQELAKKSNVVGTGIGEKIVEGLSTGVPSVIVFVEKKHDLTKLAVGDVIPQIIDGMPVDVIEVGKIQKQITFVNRVRPIQPGFSCGHGDITAGTIGGVFIDKDGDAVILSNNHVLSNENKAKSGDPIFQPGPYDAGPSLDRVWHGWTDPIGKLPYIATLKRFVHLNSTGNIQDSAIAVIPAEALKHEFVNPIYPSVNKPLMGFGKATIGQQVQKCGRTTGYTIGRVLALNAQFTIEYDFGGATFEGCVVTSPMSDGGDSGSLINDMDMKAVAHLFAGSDKVTIANPIENAVNEYGLKPWALETGHTTTGKTIGGRDWTTYENGGTLNIAGDTLNITAKANQFCCLETNPGKFISASCEVFTGTDGGATWGPGIVVQWPNGSIKVNLRSQGSFGGYLNAREYLGRGKTKSNTWYGVRIRLSQNSYVGEVNDAGSWHTILEVPRSVFPLNPIAVRLGKTGENGNRANYSDLGADGQCAIRAISLT